MPTYKAYKKRDEPKELHSITIRDGYIVYGLANPKNNNLNELKQKKHTTEAAVLTRLKKAYNVDLVISLHESHNSQPAVDEVEGLDLVSIPLEDICGLVPRGAPIPAHKAADLMDICDKVRACQEQNQQVAIFCGAGNGRTGTALVCLLLNDMYTKNPDLLEKPTLLGMAKGSNGESLEVPLPVVRAIEMVRLMSGNSQYVESASDLQSLANFHEALTDKLAKEAGITLEEPDPPPLPPTPNM